MVGSPSPRLVADPYVAPAPPYPPSVPIRSPLGDHDDRGGPAVPVLRDVDPPAVFVEVAGVHPEVLRQVPVAVPPGEDDPVPLRVPTPPVVGRGERGMYRVTFRTKGQHAAGPDRRRPAAGFRQDRAPVHGDVRP